MSIELKDKLVTLESLAAVYNSEVTARNAAIAAEASARDAAITDAINDVETGAPTKVDLVSQMTDPDKIYLYMGEESGYTAGHIYSLVNGTPVDKGVYGGVNIDNTLTVSGQAADAKVTGDEIAEIKEDLSAKAGLSEEAKQALLACFAKVAWVGEHGQDYYDALQSALYPPIDLVRITAVYTQSGTIYNTDNLDSLKPDLVVTAHYSDSTSGAVTSYVLSGTLAEGTSTITVTYGGKTTTFTVTVSVPQWLLEWSYLDGATPIVFAPSDWASGYSYGFGSFVSGKGACVALTYSGVNTTNLYPKNYETSSDSAYEVKFNFASAPTRGGVFIRLGNGTVGMEAIINANGISVDHGSNYLPGITVEENVDYVVKAVRDIDGCSLYFNNNLVWSGQSADIGNKKNHILVTVPADNSIDVYFSEIKFDVIRGV